MNSKKWWPLRLSNRLELDLAETKELFSQKINFDSVLNNKSSELLARFMKRYIQEIIDKDGLPHLCHVINGWGNATYNQNRILQNIEHFLHQNPDGKYSILQCDPEGDFHPWQTFAYCFMAGVNPDHQIMLSKGYTSLREIALNSTNLNTSKGIELGHTLFSLAFLNQTVKQDLFIFDNTKHSIESLVQIAIHAHKYGGFEVCRKFHLTEGLCAITSSDNKLEQYKDICQRFLEGQMDMLFLLGSILRHLKKAELPIDKHDIIYDIRNTLNVGNLIENHFYYAGHLIELAAFASNYGFNISTAHWNAMSFIVNELNAILPQYIHFMPFTDCFLALGHYRRAITLLDIIHEAKISKFNNTDLEYFTVDFDNLKSEESNICNEQPSILSDKRYNVAKVTSNVRQEFVAVINEYKKIADVNMLPRGTFDHFRRISPPHWPRALHYEFLDKDGKISTELHFEAFYLLPFQDQLNKFTHKLKAVFPDNEINLDSAWYHNCGRIQVFYKNNQNSKDIAFGMDKLIKATFKDLNNLVQLI